MSVTITISFPTIALDLSRVPDGTFDEMYDTAINYYEHRKGEIGKAAASEECRPILNPFELEAERRADAKFPPCCLGWKVSGNHSALCEAPRV